MAFSFDTFAALMALIGAIASAAVCRWRIADLERRVAQLESAERNHSDRVVKIETQLENITDLLGRIADKLDVR